MGDRLLTVMLEHPWGIIGLITGLTIFVLSIKWLFDTVTGDLGLTTDSRQGRQEELARALAVIDEKNQEVADELLKLTELARLQLVGRAGTHVDQEVADSFVRLDRLVSSFEAKLHQPWVRAVVGGYRTRVRSLMDRHGAHRESAEALVEVLEEVHSEAVSRLKLRRRRDGRFQVMYPVDAKGSPFEPTTPRQRSRDDSRRA